jgi:hypothetical protein
MAKMYGGQRMMGGQMAKMYGGQRMMGGQMAKMYGGQRMMGGQKLYGGAQIVAPATVDDTSMLNSSKLNLAQGGDYQSLHEGQHGGAISFANSAPPGYTGILDDSLRAAARVIPVDQSIAAASGMKDQGGGGRRRRKASRRKGAKGKKASRRRRAMRGGAAMTPFSTAADVGSPGMLMSPGMEHKAMMGMHTAEWKLAENPNSFTPKM